MLGLLALIAVATTSLVAAAPAAAAEPYFEIRARRSNKCLDVAYMSTAHGANVLQAYCRGTYNQQWTRASKGVDANGYLPYELRPRHAPTMCLDVAHMSRLHGADVVQASCWGGANQQWRLVGTDSGFYKLVSRHSGLCLDVANGSIAHGADVVQARCWSPGFNQQWGWYGPF